MSIGVASRWSRSLGKWRHLGNDSRLTRWLSLLRSDDQMATKSKFGLIQLKETLSHEISRKANVNLKPHQCIFAPDHFAMKYQLWKSTLVEIKRGLKYFRWHTHQYFSEAILVSKHDCYRLSILLLQDCCALIQHGFFASRNHPNKKWSHLFFFDKLPFCALTLRINLAI